MAESSGNTSRLQGLLDAAAAGDEQAYAELMAVAAARLRKLTGKMLWAYPQLRRWEQTDDIFQEASLRLYRSLNDCRPDSVRDFLGLAALQIRRTLIDLCRHHFGPMSAAANHDHVIGGGPDETQVADNVAAASGGPSSLDAWADFHDAVSELPNKAREVFHLVWYAGLPQAEIAQVLGISVPTVQRRWYQARHHLFTRLHGHSPLS